MYSNNALTKLNDVEPLHSYKSPFNAKKLLIETEDSSVRI